MVKMYPDVHKRAERPGEVRWYSQSSDVNPTKLQSSRISINETDDLIYKLVLSRISVPPKTKNYLM